MCWPMGRPRMCWGLCSPKRNSTVSWLISVREIRGSATFVPASVSAEEQGLTQ